MELPRIMARHGVGKHEFMPPPQNLWVEAHWFLKFNSSGLRSEET
jgi:hypothetical protein